MNTNVRIPQGDDTIRVELTVKEAMALAGIKFHHNHAIEVSARKKLNHILEEHYIVENKAVN